MARFERETAKSAIPPAKAIWIICPKCKSHFEKAVWKKNNCICPKCNYHGRLAVRERIRQVGMREASRKSFFGGGKRRHKSKVSAAVRVSVAN